MNIGAGESISKRLERVLEDDVVIHYEAGMKQG